ncbi:MULTISPECIES: hypothetical protein [unclassified Haematobacter]|uniref:hypothetical protein n=1 Tax=unclassified Haematobacter TaxID=2640585 RepID=UPI0025C609B1|nr:MULTISPECIES: hypothetical protein [unclassified Haematobacter]
MSNRISAADASLPSRRDVLIGLAAAPMAALPLSAQPTDPHQAWLEEWRTTEEAWADAGEDTPEADAVWARRTELGELLATTPATSLAGAAAQLSWVMEDAPGQWGYVGHSEAVGSANALLQRLMN